MTNAIAPSQSRSCFCGKPTMSEPHHVVHRSMGGDGTEHNLVDICTEHHAMLHPEKFGGMGISVQEHSAERLLIIDNATGEIIHEEHYATEWDQGAYIAGLDRLVLNLGDAIDKAKYLDREGLEAAYQATRNMGKGVWIYQAELIYWAVRKTAYGSKTEKLQAVAQKLGFGKSKGWELLQLREAMPTMSAHAENLVTDKPSLLREAVRADDPQAALQALETALVAQPDITVRSFREMLKADDNAATYCTVTECPACGARLSHLEAK